MNALATVPRETTADDSTLVLQIPVDQIDVGENVRVDVEGIEELAASIKEHGLKQPIKVRPDAGRWLVVYGQRRLLAHRLAGIERIPAIVATESYTPGSLAIEQLIENLHRVDLPPLNRARAMRAVVDAGTSQADLARELGLHPSTVANDLSLLEAPEAIRNSIEKGDISPAHAKALKGLAPKSQVSIAKEAIANGWSAHETERQVQERKRRDDAERERQAKESKDPAARKVELAASIVTEAEKKKVAKDAQIIVSGSGYYGESGGEKEVAELLTAAGFTNVTVAKGWREIDGRPAGCTCTAWKATSHSAYDYSKRVDGYYPQTHRVALTKGCIDRKHEQAKAAADEAKRQDKVALQVKVQQHVKSIAIGVVIPQTSPETPDLIGIPRILAEAILWDVVGYNMPDWAEKHGGTRSKPWAAIHALTDEALASELASKVAGDFRDKNGYHIDWPALADELLPKAEPVAPTPPEDTRLQPAFGDPVVDVEQGTKYRVSRVGPHALQLAAAVPAWRNGAIVRLADPSRLEYDKEAGLWRGPTVPVEPTDEGAPA